MTHGTTKRPYFNKNIEELSSLFHENQENTKVLKQILHELSFRSRPKAKALARTVRDLLEDTHNQVQLSLPLTPPAQKTMREEMVAIPETPHLEGTPEEEERQQGFAEIIDPALPQPPESLWGKLMHWFKSR